jgi:hypothetical protein
MLVIRSAQMRVLEDQVERRFRARLTAQIEQLFPGEIAALRAGPAGTRALEDFLNQAGARASGYGIEDSGDFAVLIALWFATRPREGGEEDGLAWARPILESRGASGRVKLALIDRRLRAQVEHSPDAARLCAITDAMREQFR